MNRLALSLLLSINVCPPAWSEASRQFDGNGDFFTCNTASAVTNGTTWAAWVNLNNVDDAGSEHRMIGGLGATTGSVGDFFAIGEWFPSADTKIGYGWNNGGWVDNFSTSEVALTGWQHVAATYDGSNVRFYLNGATDGAPAQTSSMSTGTHTFYVGTRNNLTDTGYNFEGFLSNVVYYQRVLSQTEITEQLIRIPEYLPVTRVRFIPILGDATEVDLSDNGADCTLSGNSTASSSGPPIMIGDAPL